MHSNLPMWEQSRNGGNIQTFSEASDLPYEEVPERLHKFILNWWGDVSRICLASNTLPHWQKFLFARFLQTPHAKVCRLSRIPPLTMVLNRILCISCVINTYSHSIWFFMSEAQRLTQVTLSPPPPHLMIGFLAPHLPTRPLFTYWGFLAWICSISRLCSIKKFLPNPLLKQNKLLYFVGHMASLEGLIVLLRVLTRWQESSYYLLVFGLLGI